MTPRYESPADVGLFCVEGCSNQPLFCVGHVVTSTVAAAPPIDIAATSCGKILTTSSRHRTVVAIRTDMVNVSRLNRP